MNTSRAQWQEAIAAHGTAVLAVDARGGFESDTLLGLGVHHCSIRHFGKRRVDMVPRRFGSVLRTGDLVVLHEGWTLSNVVAAWQCVRRAIPYVIMPHGAYDEKVLEGRLKYRRLRELLERVVVHHARAVWLYFDAEAVDVRRFAPRAEFITAVTGYTVQSSNPNVVRRGRDAERYVGWYGRFDIKHKGLDVLLAAMVRLPEAKRPLVRLVGPDYGGDKPRFEQAILERGMGEWMRVEPEKRGDDLRDFVLGADLIIHPAKWEAFGRVIVEVMAMSQLVAVSMSTHIASVIPDSSIIKFRCDSIALAQVLANIPDGDVAASIAQAGRKWVQTHLNWSVSVDTMWKELERHQIFLGDPADATF
ncbi:glycosyltransferase family 4 protein [Rhodococcus sp. BP-332]|uniref:glycosyltransferase family 4 protein n=1 Tax=Rhodococcus sp. BP-332 TaxID=2739447 RepID=UPI001C9A6D43|nr:glycosyltransferase family 4 protein [Rhodococcus sp. BP-332]MBY6678744.1 glycosyltransferase family 4 protein [Rhodococcus sp. BP-332]